MGDTTPPPVAVIGMSCRVAGAETPAELWRLVDAGERRFTEVPPGRWPGLDRSLAATARAALLERIDDFDARFFGIAPRMAAWLDPQHRMLLELAQHAVENAGYDPVRLRDAPIAVFAGAFMSDYDQLINLAGRADSAALPGTLMAFLANRVSYQFAWTGPSLVIDSACSSGLAALGIAVRGLQAGEYPMALVGAANVINAGFYANNAYRGGALSPTGESVPFSASRDGYVRGEGGACVLLKPLDAALADGDPVHAVIRAVGTAHKGRAGGLTGSDAAAQEALWRRTAAAAGIRVCDIGFLEAHGTGTPGGDGVELQALAQALDQGPQGRVRVGSVKANIGHLEAASGLIGMVKTALVLRHGRIPGVAGLGDADPALPTGGGRIEVSADGVAWPGGPGLRRAAVNSFGLGGTISQVILEEPPVRRLPPPATQEPVLVPLSAGTPEGLAAQARRLLLDLDDEPATDPAAVAWTLRHGRPARAERLLLCVRDTATLRAGLRGYLAGTGHPAVVTGADGDWEELWGDRSVPPRVALSGSVFDRKRHWFDENAPAPLPL
ncbi:beta-ketoacyl synthase N-terminal-like domain-containing protein [Actinoplanes sp. NPDC051475]|uniref:polyketide synthase n=1 Tax=Actinoplanes sp. NPDC051475 TaxID=3157225 RepID=UPI003450B3C8